MRSKKLGARSIASAASLLVLVAAMAACGSSSDTTSAEPSAEQTTTAEDAPSEEAAPAQPAEEILMAGPAALTGPLAFAGVPARQACDLAIEELNASGALENRAVVINWEDSAGTPEQAITITTKALQNPAVLAVPLADGSSSALAVGEVAQSASTPLLAMIGTAATVPLVGEWVLQGGTNAETPALSPVKYVLGNNPDVKKVGIVFIETNAGQVIYKDHVVKYLTDQGYEVVGPEPVADNQSNYSSVIQKFKGADVDAIYLAMYGEAGANFIVQANTRGLGENVVWIANQGTSDPKLWEIGGDLVNGLVMDSALNPNAESGLAKEFNDNYTAKYGAAPNVWGVFGYNMCQMAGKALENLNGQEVTKRSFLDAMLALQNIDSVVGQGKFGFGPNGESLYEALVVAVDGEKFVTVG